MRKLSQILMRPLPSPNRNNGQALVELAIIGSILIFCFAIFLQYAMGGNYQQRISMEGFRKAFERAREPDSSSGFRQVSYTVVEDKPTPDPANQYGLMEMSPVGSSTSAVWSQEVFAEMDGIDREIPRVDYEIDGERHTYKTAAFVEKPLTDNMRKRENKELWSYKGAEGVFWEWKTVQPYKVKAGDMLDIDGDGEEELVIKVDRPLPHILPEAGDLVLVLDYQEGEVDLSGKGEEAGGLFWDYEVTRRTLSPSSQALSPSSFVRTDEHSGITTTTKTNLEETFTRHIKKRAKDLSDVETIVDTIVTTIDLENLEGSYEITIK